MNMFKEIAIEFDSRDAADTVLQVSARQIIDRLQAKKRHTSSHRRCRETHRRCGDTSSHTGIEKSLLVRVSGVP